MKKSLSILLCAMLLIACVSAAAEGKGWICPECGASNTMNFCPQCGAKKPEGIVCPGCGREYPADTDAIFCGKCGTKLRQEKAEIPRYEGDGFATPEDAALCYMAGLKNLDFEQMLSAFAWETQAEHFDFRAFITRTKGVSWAHIPGAPASNDLLRSLVVEQIRDYQIHIIYYALVNYVNNEIYGSQTVSVRFGTEEEAEEYLRRCDNGKIEKLSGMENVRFYSPDDVTGGRFSNEKIVENYRKQNARYGADETKDIVIAADIGDDVIAVAPTAARYGDRWYLVNTGSMTQTILAVDPYSLSLFVLPDDMKGQLKNLVPVASASSLPEKAETRYSYEGEGFDTPEAAVSSYLEGLKNRNAQQMLRAFAWETAAGRYSLKEYANRMKMIFADSPVQVPVINDFVRDASLGSLRYQQSQRIFAALRSYLMEDNVERFSDFKNGYWTNLPDEETVDAFIRTFDNDKAEKLKGLGNIQLFDPAFLIPGYDSPGVREQLDWNQRMYGADEAAEYLAAAELEGETLIINPRLARYGNKWYMISASGSAFSYLGIDANQQAFVFLPGSLQDAMNMLQP